PRVDQWVQQNEFSKDFQDEGPLLSLAEIEKNYIRHVLKKVNNNKRKAASILGIGRRTLYRKLEQLDSSE
ncbi:MAG: helix-turn-helix domain-containing protein, partial [Desulfonatronovibrio sp.]